MRNHNTKLTETEVRAMRKAHVEEGISFTALSLAYRVTITTASNACQGKGAYKEVK